jgi:hypothetical protein
MDHVLGEAGRAFVKAFASAVLIVAIGVSQQATLHDAVAVGIAGVMAAIAAGLAAVQVFVPRLSVRAYIAGLAGAAVDSFLHAFLGSFIVAVAGIFQEPNYSAWHALVIAALIGAVNAGLRAVQGLATLGEKPDPTSGVREGAMRGKGLLPA